MTLDRARAEVPYDILQPHDALANPDNLKAVWKCPAKAVRLEYESGVDVVIDVNTIRDPEASWKRPAQDDPNVYSTGMVRGVLPNLIDPAGDPTGEALGGVTLVENALYVSVGGNGSIPLDRLIQITESLRRDQ